MAEILCDVFLVLESFGELPHFGQLQRENRAGGGVIDVSFYQHNNFPLYFRLSALYYFL